MSNLLGIYRYNMDFYTGSDLQPDTISVFVKAGSNENSFQIKHLNALANWCGYFPIVSTFTGLIRIVTSVKKIFEDLSQAAWNSNDSRAQEAWNGVKNLFRGLVEMVPLIGNASLIVYDSIRAAIYFDGPIQHSIANEDNIAGVAFDGKIIFTIPLDRLDAIFNEPPRDVSHQLARFEELFQMYFNRNEEARLNSSRETVPLNILVPQLEVFLQNRQRSA